MVRVRATVIGWRARQALERSGGAARPLGPAPGYLEAAGEIVWLGTGAAALHGRAVVAGEIPAGAGDLHVDIAAASLWRPSAIVHDRRPEAFGATAGRLRDSLHEVGEPRGLGALPAGRTPAFPLASAGAAAGSLAHAVARGEAAAAVNAATALIGLGPGLTPSGDDFVGGAFFARAALALDAPDEAWRRAAAEVRALARTCTHPVSAALLADLTEGHGWAPLHDLAGAVAAGDDAAAIAAARAVVRLGHSSGWDLLAGFLGALTAGRDR